VVSVSDEGKSISKQDLPRLFERFYRVHENQQNIPGFGIGLYLCYEIITRHKGKIWVDSNIGKGSTFYFSLPVLKEEHDLAS
jgi:signal transduction histidine kinase